VCFESPHCYRLLEDDPAFDAFVLQTAVSVVNMQHLANSERLPIVKYRKEPPFQKFNADILARHKSECPPAGRLGDVFLSASAFAASYGLWTIYFVKTVTTEKRVVDGIVYSGGQRRSVQYTIDANVEVFERRLVRPTCAHFAADVVALLFLIQFLGYPGVPVLQEWSDGEARPHFAVSSGVYNRWMEVTDIGGSDCCVLPLVGLLQFPCTPCRPQHQDTKYLNWGFNLLGLFDTKTYNQGAPAFVQLD
jgi:hypothetical protein